METNRRSTRASSPTRSASTDMTEAGYPPRLFCHRWQSLGSAWLLHLQWTKGLSLGCSKEPTTGCAAATTSNTAKARASPSTASYARAPTSCTHTPLQPRLPPPGTVNVYRVGSGYVIQCGEGSCFRWTRHRQGLLGRFSRVQSGRTRVPRIHSNHLLRL